MLARDAGLDEEENVRLSNGEPLEDGKLESLRLFTISLVENRGNVSEEDWALFQESGGCRQQALEIVFAVAMKVMSNYTNALSGVPLDDEVRGS